MREKIISQLRAKYPGVNLSKKRMDAIADRLTPKIKDESEIDAKLDELNEILPFADIAKDDDRLRTLEEKSKKPAQQQQQTEKTDTDPETKKEDSKKEDEMPSWAKELVTEVKSLRQEKVQATMQQKLAAHEKLKGIPSIFYKGRPLPEKEEELDAFVETIAADYATFKAEEAKPELKPDGKPASGKPDGVDKKPDPKEIDAVLDKII
jgi:hypothetical protein